MSTEDSNEILNNDDVLYKFVREEKDHGTDCTF